MMQKFENIRQSVLLSVLCLAILVTGCKKFLHVKAPSSNVSQENVYNSEETAIAVLTQVYAALIGESSGITGKDGISVLSGLSADELTLIGSVTSEKLLAYYRNDLRSDPDAKYGHEFWTICLKQLFTCNAAIEGLNKSSSLTEGVKTQLLGEAKFMRALFCFYLVSYYGDVPLVLTTDPNVNRVLPRSPQQRVYEQIVIDLKDAQVLLSSFFPDASLLKSTSERVRPTKWAATALLARTYLAMSQFAEAENESTKIIENSSQFALPGIDKVFLRNSTEAIWQLQPTAVGRNTEDAFTFILPSTGPNRNNNPVYLSPQLLNAFESGDARRQSGGWIDSVIAGGITYHYAAKYMATTTSGSFTEYFMMFRLAEQYLIRAEARAQLNNIQGAKEDLNVIRTRANLPGTTANDQSAMLTDLLHERQVELFTELGHRWLDLKRTGKIDEVMSLVLPMKANGAEWKSYQQWYPILFDDTQKNPNLTQNTGY